jgi:signal peptidase II
VSAATLPDATAARRAWARGALVLGLVLALDQITKRLVADDIGSGEERSFFPGLQLVHVRNKGIAFGLASGAGTVVLVLTGLALAALVVYFVRNPTRPLLWLPTGLLLGGALGNLIDRLTEGAVTDFLKLPFWPAFNIADVAITVGVLALLYVLEGPRRRET